MLNEVKKNLQNELDKYLENKGDFQEYYPGMNVLFSSLYKKQLEDAVDFIVKTGEVDENSFKLYLDTIIINMHTKVKKYKKSIYFDNESIKDIENQGFTIPFYLDKKREVYVLLGIVSV